MGKEHPNLRKNEYKVCFMNHEDKVVHRDNIPYTIRKKLLQTELTCKLTKEVKEQHFHVTQYANKLEKLIGVAEGLILLRPPPGRHECWKKRWCYAKKGSKFITFGYTQPRSCAVGNTTMFSINKNTGKIYPNSSSKKEIGDISLKTPEEFWKAFKVDYEPK